MTLVKPMYEQVKSCVKFKSGLTYFSNANLERGVRQGCLLSTVLFHYSLMIYKVICSKVVQIELLHRT